MIHLSNEVIDIKKKPRENHEYTETAIKYMMRDVHIFFCKWINIIFNKIDTIYMYMKMIHNHYQKCKTKHTKYQKTPINHQPNMFWACKINV